MRILSTGDRHWACTDLARTVLERLVVRYGRELTIVRGGATGVDQAFGDAAQELGLIVEAHPADWSLGKRAGPIRNAKMIELGADLCLAVHRFIMNSKGTRGCAWLASQAGIPTYLIDSEEGVPKRLLPDDPRIEP